MALCVLLAAGALGAEGAVEPRDPESRGALLQPEPLGFDLGTVAWLGRIVRDLPREAPLLLRGIVARGRHAGPASSALLLGFLGVVGLVLALQRARIRWVERGLAPLLRAIAPPFRPWLAGLAQVVAAALPPLVLRLLHELVWRSTGFDGPGFPLLAIGLRAWFVWALLTSSVHELLVRPLLPVAPAHGRYLFRAVWWLASVGLCLSALLEAAAHAGAPDDLLALLRLLLELSLILSVGAFAVRKRAVLALLPELPTRVYGIFVQVLGNFYPLILVLTLGTAVVDAFGYVRLASFVWRCSWALAGVFVGLCLVLHGSRLLLRRVLERSGDPRGAALRGSASRMIDYVVLLLALRVVRDLIGLRELLGGLLGVSVLRLGDRAVSIHMLLEAAAVVLGFWLGARVLRDFLAYRVYPAFGLDESVAHAINTFLGYGTVLVGVLVAFEVVGLGAGTVTVFAGALGIGLGFGMQRLAGDLSSGLTLIFGRSLRKGDIVRIGETTGEVQEVGMRATSLISPDAVEYLVPNGELVSGTVVNWTRSSPLVREHVPLSVGYGADPERVIALLRDAAARTAGVEASPPPEVWFAELGESGLAFELLVWIDYKRAARQQVRSDLLRTVFHELRAAGIEIPFAQRDLHLRSVAPELMDALAPSGAGRTHGAPTLSGREDGPAKRVSVAVRRGSRSSTARRGARTRRRGRKPDRRGA